MPPPPKPRVAKPLIGATAPDFLRLLPELRAELERVAPLGARLQSRDYRRVPLDEIGNGGRRRND